MSGNIIEIHVDACAELSNRAIAAVEALKHLYDATGMAQLRYVETEQGLREKTQSNSSLMLESILNSSSGHADFLKRNKEWVDVVSTHHCQLFRTMLNERILPEICWPMVDAVEECMSDVQRTAFANMQETGRRKYGAAECITFPFFYGYHEGRKTTKRIHDPVLNAAFNPHLESWKKKVEDTPVLKAIQNKSGKMTHKVTLLGLTRAVQEARAIAYELALKLEPETMAEYGYTTSLLKRENAGELNIKKIKDRAHCYPPLSLRAPPFSQLKNPDILEQAVHMTALWPWHYKPALKETPYNSLLKNASHNRADFGVLDYFFNSFSLKPDVNDRVFLLITHDGPLISNFYKFRDGVKMELDASTGIHQPVALDDAHYHMQGLRKPHPDCCPYGEALTSREFIGFLHQELERAAKYQGRRGAGKAINELKQAIRNLKIYSSRDEQRHPSVLSVSSVSHIGRVVKEPKLEISRAG